MIPDFDSAIILECTTNNYFNIYHATGYIRPLGPYAVYDLFFKYGIPCTVINYTEFWQPEELVELLVSWCEKHCVKKPLVLCSSLFGIYLLPEHNIARETIKLLSSTIDCKVILGGPIDLSKASTDFFNSINFITPYAIFKGRSLHMLERWINKKPMDPEWVSTKNLIYTYYDSSTIIKEEPVIPILHDDYCLTSKDSLSFETRLGCKFNCTFCGYAYRNAKDTTDATEEKLHKFFSDAYNKYGITNFTSADDTFNEDDIKVTRLHDATRNLPYQPSIGGYNRLDLLMAKPHNMDLLDESGFHGHFFGIETLHREASKLIRKGFKKQEVYNFLSHIKERYPHWHTNASFIVGIPKEPEEHFVSVLNDFRNNRYVTSMMIFQLVDKRDIDHDRDRSDIFLNPEKYGIQEEHTDEPFLHGWKHDLMNFERAREIRERESKINEEIYGILPICPWEWTGRKLYGSLKECNDHVQGYIDRKKQFVKNI